MGSALEQHRKCFPNDQTCSENALELHRLIPSDQISSKIFLIANPNCPETALAYSRWPDRLWNCTETALAAVNHEKCYDGDPGPAP